MNSPRLLTTVLLLAALLVAPAPAPAVQQPPGDAVLASSEVLLDLVATDKKGQPVTDLRQDEIEVYENGARQPITSFGLFRTTASADTVAAAAESGPFARSPLRGRNALLIVVDRGTVQRANLAQIYRTVERFISERLAVTDAVAVFGVTSRPIMVQNFTNDKAKLLEAMRRVTAGTSVPLQEAIGDAARVDLVNAQSTDRTSFESALEQTARGVDRYSATLRDQIQTLGLIGCVKAIAKAAGTVEGRKTMILFSEGFAVTHDTENAFTGMIGDANRANLTINAVDAAGLDAGVNDRSVSTSRGITGVNESDSRISVSEGESTLDRSTKANVTSFDEALARVASGTGGVLVRNTNDLARGLRAIENALRAYYVISYALAGELDGGYRAITVKVLRKGVEARTRSGYYATPAEATTAFEAPILAMLSAPGPAPTALRVALKTERFRAGSGWDVPVVLSVDAADLAPVRAGAAGGSDFRLDAVVVVRDEAGATVATVSRSALYRVPDVRMAEFRKDRIALVCFSPGRPFAPGRYTLQVGVHDPTSKRATVLTRAIVVPDLPGSGAPAISSLVLGRSIEPGGGSASDPFLVGSATLVVPDPTARFSKARGDRLYAFFRLAAAPGAGYRMQLQVLRDTTAVVASPIALLPLADARGDSSNLSTLSLDALEPGSYRAVVVILAVDAPTPVATASASFTVEP